MLLAAVCLAAGACQQQMATQPALKPDQASDFFPDGLSVRPLVPGTVAVGHLHFGQPVFTGSAPGKPSVRAQLAALGAAASGRADQAIAALLADANPAIDAFPFPIDRKALKLGQNRYAIYCSVCHDLLGTGHGKIVERGFTPPPSLHSEDVRHQSAGHIFAVITNGHGAMPDYRQQIPPRERWAIVAYVRALQLSQRFPRKELPKVPDLRARLEALAPAQKERKP
jgi:mono/diheme cytochrome c family protein